MGGWVFGSWLSDVSHAGVGGSCRVGWGVGHCGTIKWRHWGGLPFGKHMAVSFTGQPTDYLPI